jgi:hypothetical protein
MGGTLEALWDDYGPDGDNSLRVFFIEADCGTNNACLCGSAGCNGSTQGNWMAGTGFPVFNPVNPECTNIKNDYSISFYPTLYAINAQHKTAWYVGQTSKAGWEGWFFESFTLEANPDIIDDICNKNEGAIYLNVSGGKGNLTYLWNTGAKTQNLENIPSGTYTVKITDQNGYFINISGIEVLGNNDPLTYWGAEVQNTLCYGSDEGSIIVEFTGGLLPYTFNWSNGATTQNIYNLPAGEYVLETTDGYGCTEVLIYNIQQPDLLLINPVAINTTCGESNGSIYMNPTGGTIPYTYYVNGEQTSAAVFLLDLGTYELFVTDDHLCEAYDVVVVDAEPEPIADAGPNKQLNCGETNVQLDGTASSSGIKWDYLWTTPNGNIVSGHKTKTPTVDQIGTYILKVTDKVYGCFAYDTTYVITGGGLPQVFIADPDTLTCSFPEIELDGTGSAEGEDVSYLWTTENGNIVSGHDEIIAVVDQLGEYLLTVTYTDNGCASSKTVIVSADMTLPEAEASNTTISCDDTQVEICVLINGEYGSFGWANGSTGLCIQVSSAGEYFYTVTGTNGCQFTGSAIVEADNTLPVANVADHGKLQCGIASIQIGGEGSSEGDDYAYLWTTEDGNIVGENNTLVITVDQPGKYILHVINILNDCASKDSTIVETGPIFPDAEFEHIVNYNEVHLIGFYNPHSSSIWVSNGETKEGNEVTFSYLENGTYEVCHYVENDCGTDIICVDIEVSAILPLAFTVSKSDITCFGNTDGAITVLPSGGIGAHSISWTGPDEFSSQEFSISQLSSGFYQMELSDEGNNLVVNTLEITEPTLMTYESEVINATAGQDNGKITLDVSGGVEPYSYLWSNGATTKDISGLAAGEYSVTVTEANDCSLEITFQVGTTSVRDEDSILIYNIYPNPTNDRLFIELNACELSGHQLILNDLSGKTVLKRLINSTDNIIVLDLSSVARGLYLLQVSNNQRSIVKKISRL